MRLKISKISHDEAISAFIKGLRFHEALRNKLLRKRPTTLTPTTRKNSSGTMREVPNSLLDETIVEVVSTTGTIVAPTTGTTEKAGTGGVTIAMTSEASALATTTTR